MKIGIDLDGVIFDSEKLYRVYTELYDMIELGKIARRIIESLNFKIDLTGLMKKKTIF